MTVQELMDKLSREHPDSEIYVRNVYSWGCSEPEKVVELQVIHPQVTHRVIEEIEIPTEYGR